MRVVDAPLGRKKELHERVALLFHFQIFHIQSNVAFFCLD